MDWKLNLPIQKGVFDDPTAGEWAFERLQVQSDLLAQSLFVSNPLILSGVDDDSGCGGIRGTSNGTRLHLKDAGTRLFSSLNPAEPIRVSLSGEFRGLHVNQGKTVLWQGDQSTFSIQVDPLSVNLEQPEESEGRVMEPSHRTDFTGGVAEKEGRP